MSEIEHLDKAELEIVLAELADVIWWIKGYAEGKGDDTNNMGLGSQHLEALRKARLHVMKTWSERKREEARPQR